MTQPHLTDERIEQLERTQTYEFVTQLIHDLRLYKQQAEERGKALERIGNIAEVCGADAHIVRKISRQSIGKEQPND